MTGLRRALFWCHLCIGVVAGSVIMIMAATGAMMAFEPQIVDMAERHVRYVTVLPGAKPLSVDVLVDKVREEYPDAKPRGVGLRAAPNASVSVNLGGEQGTVYIDPYTAQILGGQSKVQDLMHDIEAWHRWLGMTGSMKAVGHQIKAAANIIFLVLLVSGIYLWWPRQWTWARVKNSITFMDLPPGKARDWNWHNTVGFWAAPFLLIIILTGVVMSYDWANDAVYRMTGNAPPAPREQMRGEGRGERGDKPKEGKAEAATLDALVAQTKAQAPDWIAMNVRLPKPGAPVTVMVEQPSAGYVHPRGTLTLDGATAAVVKWEPASQQNSGRKWRTLVRYAHTGEAGGIIGQILAFLAAAGAVVLVWTGFCMAWHRFVNRKK